MHVSFPCRHQITPDVSQFFSFIYKTAIPHSKGLNHITKLLSSTMKSPDSEGGNSNHSNLARAAAMSSISLSLYLSMNSLTPSLASMNHKRWPYWSCPLPTIESKRERGQGSSSATGDGNNNAGKVVSGFTGDWIELRFVRWCSFYHKMPSGSFKTRHGKTRLVVRFDEWFLGIWSNLI